MLLLYFKLCDAMDCIQGCRKGTLCQRNRFAVSPHKLCRNAHQKAYKATTEDHIPLRWHQKQRQPARRCAILCGCHLASLSTWHLALQLTSHGKIVGRLVHGRKHRFAERTWPECPEGCGCSKGPWDFAFRHSQSKGSPNVIENSSCFTFECSCQTAPEKKNTNTTKQEWNEERLKKDEPYQLKKRYFKSHDIGYPGSHFVRLESESTPVDCCNDSSVIQVQMANSWMRSFN